MAAHNVQDTADSDFSDNVYLERCMMQEAGKLPYRHPNNYYRNSDQYPTHMEAWPKDNMPRTWRKAQRHIEPPTAEELQGCKEDREFNKEYGICNNCNGTIEPGSKYANCESCRESWKKYRARIKNRNKHVKS